MTTLNKLFRKYCSIRNCTQLRNFVTRIKPHNENKLLKIICVTGGTIIIYSAYKLKLCSVYATNKPKPEHRKKPVKLRSREKWFIRFASVKYAGQLFMTPQDFVDSVLTAEPRLRSKRTLTETEINQIYSITPSVKEGSPTLFRSLGDKGIISYTEYLFLILILTKPESGFRIAFNLFDINGNQKVDKDEFLIIMENIFTSRAVEAKSGLLNQTGSIEEQLIESLQSRHSIDTTLSLHFFGPNRNKELNFESFRQFMLNLQMEVIELEFIEFSRGMPTITELDFAKIMLRFNYIYNYKYDIYLDRVQDRIKDKKGITFNEFHIFCQFLHNLRDFRMAIKMYILANRPISKDEFHRAVKVSTGMSMSQHLINTVFAIFDKDGDGLLHYNEFMVVMKDRLHRSCKVTAKTEGWKAFKECMREEMKPE